MPEYDEAGLSAALLPPARAGYGGRSIWWHIAPDRHEPAPEGRARFRSVCSKPATASTCLTSRRFHQASGLGWSGMEEYRADVASAMVGAKLEFGEFRSREHEE